MTGNNESYIASIKKELGKSFEMTDLGYVHYYLSIEVTQHPKSIFLSQKKYIGDLLNRFGMIECNPLTTPMEQNLKLTSIEGKEFEDATKYRQLVGSLIYLTTIRPDISFVVGILSRLPLTPANLIEKSRQQEIHSRVYLVPQVKADPMSDLTLPANTVKSLRNHCMGQRLASRGLHYPFCWIDLLDEYCCSALLAQNLASPAKSRTTDNTLHCHCKSPSGQRQLRVRPSWVA
eukprot:PITA_32080